MNPHEFIEYWARILADIAPRHGIRIISAPLAQTILESGWGKSSLAVLGHNYWGIKAGTSWTGDTLTLDTSEEESGHIFQIKGHFRKYPSDEAGAEDYFTLMDLPRYATVKSAKSAQEYLTAIRAAGYCTSSSYVDSCIKIVDQYSLTRFDHKEDHSMDFSKYAGMISNSGSDERGKLSGGLAGDQTGGEWRIRTWYDRPWNCVLRHPDPAVRAKLAELAVKAAQNDKIGYDQARRDTYWAQLQAVGYDPSKISTPCNADCSAGVIANVKAAGKLLGIDALAVPGATYTGNMRDSFRKAGFQVLTDQKYLKSCSYLETGDILLNDVHHTAMYVGPGAGSASSSSSSSSSSSGSTPAPETWMSSGGWKHVQAATLSGEVEAKALYKTLEAKGVPCECYQSGAYYIIHCGQWKESKAKEILRQLKMNGLEGMLW